MTRQKRLNDILELLTSRSSLDVSEAADLLDVSPATVRRDFDHLAAQQLLNRTHGGAVPVGAAYELPLRYKIARRADEKIRIARAAASMVQRGAVIGLNGGTTTSEVARALASRPDFALRPDGPSITVVTNSLNIATELAVRPQIKIVLTGGVARPQSYELIGPLAAPVLDQLIIDITFLGVDAIDPESGAAARHEGEASVNRHIAERARRVVVVADTSKLKADAFARICPTEDIDVFITDAALDPETARAFAERGVEIVVADGASPPDL